MGGVVRAQLHFKFGYINHKLREMVPTRTGNISFTIQYDNSNVNANTLLNDSFHFMN